MARFNLFLSVATFLLLHPQGIWRAEAQDQSTPTSNTAARINCLQEMNDARSLAGFAAFKAGSASEETSLLIEDQNFVDHMCEMVSKNIGLPAVYPVKTWFKEKQYTTYAFASRKGSELDCAAAVGYWKSAFPNFASRGLPPPFTYNDSLYRDWKNESFIVLFNPSGNPTIDCATVTCPLKDDKALEAQGAKQGTQASPPIVIAHAISCLTSPDAYTLGEPPYTEQQWERITQGFTGTREGSAPNGGVQPSRSLAPLPFFLAFAAAALAVALL